jgi:hypothetical protein
VAAVNESGNGEARATAASAMDAAEAFLARFVCFPSEHTRVASTLWVAHTYLLERFDSTPRLAFLSPEPGSGKTRALEVIGSMVRRPIHAVHCTPAALFRAVGDTEHRPTILFDEADTVFGPRARDNEEIRGFLNAGHRRSGTALRCVGMGTQQRVVEFPSFAAVALAGLHDLPGTIASRAVIVRMRRRAPGEYVEPYRQRLHEPQGLALGEHLAEALAPLHVPVEPHLPAGVTDRPADVWEPLLGIAQAVGGGWAGRAADACVALVSGTAPSEQSLSLLLLADLRRVFTDAAAHDELPTATILSGLHTIEESPWRDLRGRPLDASALARRLRGYEVRPVNLRVGEAVVKGYRKADLRDPWERYLPAEVDHQQVHSAPSPHLPLQPLQPLQPTPHHTHLVLGEGSFGISNL